MKFYVANLVSIFFIVIMVLSSCKEKETDDTASPSVVPKDDRGYCKIDEKDWQSCTKFMQIQEAISYFYPGSMLQIEFNNVCRDTSSDVYLELQHVNDTGWYELSNHHFGSYRLGSGTYLSSKTDSMHIGFVHITKFDKYYEMISGTFDMFLFDSARNKTIHISEGHFNNVRYTQL